MKLPKFNKEKNSTSALINMLKTLHRPYQLDSKKSVYSYKSDHRNGKFGLNGAEKLFDYLSMRMLAKV